MNEETRYRLLKLLSDNPDVSQRRLAKALGVSLGKANYCLKALVEKGWVKAGNFARNEDKRAYVYLLTPKGIEEKARVTLHFLKRKQREYDALEQELERLRREAAELSWVEDAEPLQEREKGRE